MPADRYIITDRQWAKIEPQCLGKKSDPGRTGGDARLFVEGVFWIARTGAQWRDLPGEFGKWNSVYRRFRDWSIAEVFERIFKALSDEPDMEMAMIDGTIVNGSSPRTGFKRGTQSQAIGKSKGGWTTKILALTDVVLGLADAPGKTKDDTVDSQHGLARSRQLHAIAGSVSALAVPPPKRLGAAAITSRKFRRLTVSRSMKHGIRPLPFQTARFGHSVARMKFHTPVTLRPKAVISHIIH